MVVYDVLRRSMTTTTTDLAAIPNDVLKTDCLGRIRFPAALRNELLDRFETSGMTGVEFAEFYHIKYPTFATWRQNRQRQRRQDCEQLETGSFVELAMPEAPMDRD